MLSSPLIGPDIGPSSENKQHAHIHGGSVAHLLPAVGVPATLVHDRRERMDNGLAEDLAAIVPAELVRVGRLRHAAGDDGV